MPIVAMFEPAEQPRLFGLPSGVDFAKALACGVIRRNEGNPPEALARVEIFVNTNRTKRRLTDIFNSGDSMLLPRIRLIDDLPKDVFDKDLPQSVSRLRRRLELTQLVAKLLDAQPCLAPRAALFDLADSLARLMDEMQVEGVSPEDLKELDVSDVSGHWQESCKFVALVERYFGPDSGEHPDPDALRRLAIEHLAAKWQDHPPSHPILVAGSTGSHGTMSLFMRAVAKLPQGALILPSFDFNMPDEIWQRLDDPLNSEDHPQFRFAQLLRKLDAEPSDVCNWCPDQKPFAPERNHLISLALRPAPVTDQWLTEGKILKGIAKAASGLTLIEAPSLRAEASAIALALRETAETKGKTAALITPDRLLIRQVVAALDRWNLIPNDSAGQPLPLSPTGRFFRHIAAMFGQKVTAEGLLTLLKHPLTNIGSKSQEQHFFFTGMLEMELRRNGPPFPTAETLREWNTREDEGLRKWADWIGSLIKDLPEIGPAPLEEHIERHIDIAEAFAAGPNRKEKDHLLGENAEEEAARCISELRREAKHGGVLSPADYSSLFHTVLNREVTRKTLGKPHPRIMIWGTLEARAQSMDLVILSGLNEGVWPGMPAPDPWLNRTMRHRAGLSLPERRIGLAALDFQQAVAGKEVILTRAVRDAEAQTVPSRWLNRLTNLMGGLSDESRTALEDMRLRGRRLLLIAEKLDKPDAVLPAKRPSPRPPVHKRPEKISITEVQTLIRDPYAVYARRVLGLSPLDPLRRTPDAPMRGTIVHEIMEEFMQSTDMSDQEAARKEFARITEKILSTKVSWPTARRLWKARLLRLTDWFIKNEAERRKGGQPAALERSGSLALQDIGVELYGKIDRVDRETDGSLAIYDYKTGPAPTDDQRKYFDKQLPLSALLAERGGVENLDAQKVSKVGYIGLGSNPKSPVYELTDEEAAETEAELILLLKSYQDPKKGYTSRRAVEKQSFSGDYDHLARFGEWNESDDPFSEDIK